MLSPKKVLYPKSIQTVPSQPHVAVPQTATYTSSPHNEIHETFEWENIAKPVHSPHHNPTDNILDKLQNLVGRLGSLSEGC